MICIICGATEFSVQDGIFYCTECSTQIEETRDEQTDEVSFTRKNLVSSPSSERSRSEKRGTKYSSWITAEAYNLILFQQVNALIKLGASPKLKPTVLHIWSKYLQKCEVAFRKDYRSTEGKPRLGPIPAKRDCKVLYGDQMLFSSKNKKSKSKVDSGKESGTSEESDQSDDPISDSDSSASSSSKPNKLKYSSSARKLRRKPKSNQSIKKKFEDSIYNMKLKKTLSFCYLGLLYTEDQLALTDLIRFAYEERIPYLNLSDKMLPSFEFQHSDVSMFLAYTVPNATSIHKTSCEIAKFLSLPKHKEPSIHLAVSRFLKELNLPDDINPMVKVLYDEFREKIRNYTTIHLDEIPTDQLALSFIMVVLKMLFILDGKFEMDHSEVMIKLNSIKPDRKFFVWTEWKKQAILKEFLFLSENPGAINKFDSLSADRIISKYPYIHLKPPSNKDMLKCRSRTVSMYEIKNILSSIINIPNNAESIPTSFPTRSEINNFSKEWTTLPMFRETKEIDFTLLKKDFSSHSLSYSPLQYNSKEDELSYLLMTSLYLPDTLLKTHHYRSKHLVSQSKTIRTSSKYWFYNTHRTKVDCGTTDLVDKIPSSFKWVISFISKCSYIEIFDLYLLVIQIEKVLFLGRNYVKSRTLTSLCNKMIVD